MKGTVQRVLEIIALVLMGFVAAFDILGGIGTVCAAFFTEKYPPLWPLLDYKWLYQIFVFVTLAFGFAGVWITLKLIRGARHAYRDALLLLAGGVVFGAIRVFTSLSLRGKAAPTNINWYFHILTLAVFLLFQLPGLRRGTPFSGKNDSSVGRIGAGLAALVAGIFVATSPWWLAPSHTYQMINWADTLRMQMSVIGWVFILGGLGLLARCVRAYSPGGISPGRKTDVATTAEARR